MPNILYARPNRARQYLSIEKHQRHANNMHAKWESIPIERQTFDAADYGNHSRTDGELWGVLQNYERVGVDGEQFGFFGRPRNATDAWHGFPVVPFNKHKKGQRYHISIELLNRWVEEHVIDEDDIPTIQAGRGL